MVVGAQQATAQSGLGGANTGYWKRWQYFTNWQGAPPGVNGDVGIAYDTDWELSGTNAASATDCTHATGGGIKLLCPAVDNDQAIISPQENTGQSSLYNVDLATDDEVEMATLIKTDSDVATQLLYVGMNLTSVIDITTDDDQVLFTYDTDASGETTWQANWSIGGTDTEVDTGVTVSLSTDYLMQFKIDSARKCHFIINDKEVALSGALTTAVDLFPVIGLQALDAATCNLYVRGVGLSKEYNE